MCYSGIAIVHNVAVQAHQDLKDPKSTWGIMAPFGRYEGGQLLLEQLGIRSEYRAGCFVLLRARLVKHAVSEFAGKSPLLF